MRTLQRPVPTAHDAEVLRLAVDLYQASNTTRVPFSDRDRPIQESWLREAGRRLAAARPPDEGQAEAEDDWNRAKRSWAEQELERPRRGGRTLGEPRRPPEATPDPFPPVADDTESRADTSGKPAPASDGGPGT